mmetsp:Transcript_30852/g.48353  ORF Transcript_30852/g.48353 Transcript_30852/m.48353 type:complete len:91 (-) Transcript_30852:479-751(-)
MAISSSCFPCSTILPLSTTAMLSASRMVERRWAITTVVRLCFWSKSSNAACTIRSLSVSRALVASSRRRTEGFLTIARAIAIRCFWPPES